MGGQGPEGIGVRGGFQDFGLAGILLGGLQEFACRLGLGNTLGDPRLHRGQGEAV